MPRLPDNSVDLGAPVKLEALVPGLEESRGALYEIGVSDDGTLVGLTKDEMSESIATLRVMAASLGCTIDVVRMVIIGECQWVEPAEVAESADSAPAHEARQGKLWVAEALVTPDLGLPKDPGCGPGGAEDSVGMRAASDPEPVAVPSRGSSTTPQLRVTLTGPTTSGKSSLLGTLSTGTLDNGPGQEPPEPAQAPARDGLWRDELHRPGACGVQGPGHPQLRARQY